MLRVIPKQLVRATERKKEKKEKDVLSIELDFKSTIATDY